MQSGKKTTYRVKKATPLWSKIVDVSNYRVKYTGCHLKTFQKKKKLQNLTLALQRENSVSAHEDVFVYARFSQLSRSFDENRKKIDN